MSAFSLITLITKGSATSVSLELTVTSGGLVCEFSKGGNEYGDELPGGSIVRDKVTCLRGDED